MLGDCFIVTIRVMTTPKLSGWGLMEQTIEFITLDNNGNFGRL